MKGSNSVHASDESFHIKYATETKISFCDYFSYFIHFLATLRQITLETAGEAIMHGNLLNKTIIYERNLGKIVSIYIT